MAWIPFLQRLPFSFFTISFFYQLIGSWFDVLLQEQPASLAAPQTKLGSIQNKAFIFMKQKT
jgi:hypothetical protein